MRAVIFLFLLLAACGRPLTPAEKNFAKQIHGDTIAADRVRLVQGLPVDAVTFRRQKRPRLTCRERILPEPEDEIITTTPAAVALWNHILLSKPYYLKDYFDNYPEEMGLLSAMFFAHEITHVWQWQNRTRTQYTPWRAGREHGGGKDPYLFEISTDTRFLDYSYEQQASIVEEYVCCATLDPKAPRTERLKRLIQQEMPLQGIYIPKTVYLPWDGVEIKGICR
ncbi:hypothetical protein [Roseovarius sp.]|uniref:hypothetical protein n=1 Tax=Roseovarius sp. TaxID=1486281 RepID=UPI000C5ED8CF|nr:hypothetical protein [Roseovarius sp.]MAZ22727.1 hypothetical protein [Roseovarius sp.]